MGILNPKQGEPYHITHKGPCTGCGKARPEIAMVGFAQHTAENLGEIAVCADCAMQLARMLLEDLCEIRTAGGRHG